MSEDEGPYASEKERFNRALNQADFNYPTTQRNSVTEILDAESIKSHFVQKRAEVFHPLQQQQQQQKKTKALTTDYAALKDFDKQIVYCPTCQGFGRTSRMWPHQLKELLDNAPQTYAEVVGGLAFPDETIFLHCRYCNLKLIPELDEVEKLDARTDEEYVIESLADTRRKSQKPVMAAQKGRYNKNLKEKTEIYHKRKRHAMERLGQDYEGKESQPTDSTTRRKGGGT